MAKVHDEIGEALADFIRSQHLFFVATAPLDGAGHVNVSPKGLDSFRILGPRQVAYQDQTGSGIETVAHLRENGRLVIMFCAFEGPPKIVRLHGRGQVLLPGEAAYEELAPLFPARLGTRCLVRLDVERVSDSCGYSVPLLDYRGERRQLDDWAEHKGPDGLVDYRATKNARSLDGLPGLTDLPGRTSDPEK